MPRWESPLPGEPRGRGGWDFPAIAARSTRGTEGATAGRGGWAVLCGAALRGGRAGAGRVLPPSAAPPCGAGAVTRPRVRAEARRHREALSEPRCERPPKLRAGIRRRCHGTPSLAAPGGQPRRECPAWAVRGCRVRGGCPPTASVLRGGREDGGGERAEGSGPRRAASPGKERVAGSGREGGTSYPMDPTGS